LNICAKPYKSELHGQIRDIVGLRDTTNREDAYEAEGKNIIVDGNNTAVRRETGKE
jgi:hypothetical protein